MNCFIIYINIRFEIILRAKYQYANCVTKPTIATVYVVYFGDSSRTHFGHMYDTIYNGCARAAPAIERHIAHISWFMFRVSFSFHSVFCISSGLFTIELIVARILWVFSTTTKNVYYKWLNLA